MSVPPPGGISNDATHRPRRIGLRTCDPRGSRKRGNTRCQMQKLTPRKFQYGCAPRDRPRAPTKYQIDFFGWFCLPTAATLPIRSVGLSARPRGSSQIKLYDGLRVRKGLLWPLSKKAAAAADIRRPTRMTRCGHRLCATAFKTTLNCADVILFRNRTPGPLPP